MTRGATFISALAMWMVWPVFVLMVPWWKDIQEMFLQQFYVDPGFLYISFFGMAHLISWLLVAKVSFVGRVRDRACQKGTGNSNLTWIVYILGMPIYFVAELGDPENAKNDDLARR